MTSIEKKVKIEQRVLQYLLEEDIEKETKFLVAFSGGPDSTALLYILKDLRTDFPLTLCCLYVDHGIRRSDEIEREIDFIVRTCRALAVKLIIERIPSGELQASARSSGQSLEHIARRKRYEFLYRAALNNGCRYIALGHTANDQSETMIMRFFQGSDFSGLTGIPHRRGKIVRPLFFCSRDGVLQYLKSRKIDFVIDSTNQSEEYLRNKVRHRLIPVIKEIFPGFRQSLFSLSGKMRLIKQLVDEESARLAWQEADGRFHLDFEKFLSCPGVVRVYTLFQLHNRLITEEGKKIPYRFFSSMLSDDFLHGKRVILKGYGIRLFRKGRNLFMERDVVCNCKKGYLIFIKVDGEYRIENLCFRFFRGKSESAPLPAALPQAEEQAGQIALPQQKIKEPLVIRSRKPGDRLLLKGGTKSVKKLFSEWAVPEELRFRIPILADRQGVLAVMGRVFGYKDRIRSGMEKKSMLNMIIEYCRAEER